MNAQINHQLTPKDKSIASIAAHTATGNLPELKNALTSGLDAGLTINEIREVLIQLYAYCGFPRSLNGLSTFKSILDERKEKDIQDNEGQIPTPVSGNNETKYTIGKKTLEALTGKSQEGPLTGINAFATGIDSFLKEHLFADIFGRGVLTYQQRELATITVLASLPGLEPQLQAHIGMGLHVGLTEPQLRKVFTSFINTSQSATAIAVLDTFRTN